jgi:type II secretory pathway predicted ATPase ExeA
VEVKTDYSHLHSATRPLAQENAESRIRRIRTDRWITYARAEAVLSAMEELLTFPQRTRMPNLLLVGPTNNGKTMIVEKFRRSHQPLAASIAPEGVAVIPVIKVQMPPGPDERRFFGAVLEALAFPHMPSDSIVRRQDYALRVMRATGVRLLIIDEVHNLLSGSQLQQRRMLNLLRWLGNELQISLVGAGTAEALHAIQSDDQLANRFEPLGLPPWKDNNEYRQLLSTLEAVLPLRRPSHLASSTLAGRVLSVSEGILGEVVAMVTRAAVRAVIAGEEAITAKTLDEAGFISPSQRRRVAV